jgi:hypothetical protein
VAECGAWGCGSSIFIARSTAKEGKGGIGEIDSDRKKEGKKSGVGLRKEMT